jgi:hypothetical protein
LYFSAEIGLVITDYSYYILNESEPEYILFKNGSSEVEYEKAKNRLEGVNYTEVDTAEPFQSRVFGGEPVLGVNSSIGYISHRGTESIEEAIKVLEGSDKRSAEA